MESSEAHFPESLPDVGLKRSRSPELKLAQLRKAGGVDDVLTDNLRSQKRYLSQVRAATCTLQTYPSPLLPLKSYIPAESAPRHFRRWQLILSDSTWQVQLALLLQSP